MNKINAEPQSHDINERQPAQAAESALKSVQKSAWETPKMEDVSEQVMAQPYIRFT